jgi:hypothetical protein
MLISQFWVLKVNIWHLFYMILQHVLHDTHKHECLLMFSMCLHLLLEDVEVMIRVFFLHKISFTMIICSSFSFLMFEENCSYDMRLSTCLDELEINVSIIFGGFWYMNCFHMLNHIVQFHYISI